MLRSKALSISYFAFVAISIFFCAKGISSQSVPAAVGLSGAVRSADGKPLEGVGVSARGMSDTFTTTVYTDEAGRYSFPPMNGGQYKVWAQAVGFETSSAEAALSSGAKKQVDLTLAPLADFHKQLSGTEWAASLPEDTPEPKSEDS